MLSEKAGTHFQLTLRNCGVGPLSCLEAGRQVQ